MIPSVLALQLKHGVEDFLRTTFPMSTPLFHGMLERFLEAPGGVFKGPYLSIQLPFRQGSEDRSYFADVPTEHPPYLHQERAFRRLGGPRPRSTIVATGTGSGKTECFLYPIIDHCLCHRGTPGIKAILIYPMNALANDQAARLAGMIYGNSQLRGQVTAGLYVGQSEKEPFEDMGPAHIIGHKETLRDHPPDILLTNYKMLDYLLIRPKDRSLWAKNTPETLRYLVVDELHTFDGAQGTDLACLIRRLKARLTTPSGWLCCVGTSATLGDASEHEKLRAYAGEIFGEPFDDRAVIDETRLSAGEFLGDSLIAHLALPLYEDAPLLSSGRYTTVAEYLAGQYRLWFGEPVGGEVVTGDEWRIELGRRLKNHLFFQNLLKVLGNRPRDYAEVLVELGRVTPELKQAPAGYGTAVLTSLLALVSAARSGRPGSLKPFLNVRVQLWLRELRRMLGEVSCEPRLAFADDLTEEQLRRHLPVVHCRECNATGWAGLQRKTDGHLGTDLHDFYIAYFKDDPKAVFLFPDETPAAELRSEGQIHHLCPACLHLAPMNTADRCPECGHEPLVRVFKPTVRVRVVRNRQRADRACPYCGARNGISILGSRAASLTSVLINQLYASVYNDDKKLLTFSDNVQDAAHRAGFFAGRTFRFNFRTALQQFVAAEGRGLSLEELPAAFNSYWGRKFDEPAFIAAFIAPNMTWFAHYEQLVRHGSLPADSDLREQVEKRIGWEIYAEFGLRGRIGRTLEKSGASIAKLDPARVDRLIGRLLPALQNEIGWLRDLDADQLRLFVHGMLCRMRIQGAIFHDVLDQYVESFGNTWVINNQIYWMASFGPSARKPCFLTTRARSDFDPIVGAGRRFTWYHGWAVKCLEPLYPLIGEWIPSIYDGVLKALVHEEILEERHVRGDRVWGLRPGALVVDDQVAQLRCRLCRHSLSVAAGEATLWDGAPCCRLHCTGTYAVEDTLPDYYADLYAHGDVHRIFAAEHTGLLDREVRQELENQFKGPDRRPWDTNLLSCTPTLEMGINIGDLSSVILCSVPPAQANYMQRVGRAGRQDGNALNITVANAKAHDLYFFAEPETMLAGPVTPPGVFLNASAVLERQMTAYCLDGWVQTGVGEETMPLRLRQVLPNLVGEHKERFPHNFITYVETHRTELLDGFLQLFEGRLSVEAVDYLKRFVHGHRDTQGSLTYRLLDGLFFQFKERESLKKKVTALNRKIAQKKKETAKDRHHTEELADLLREKSALQALVTLIGDKHTLNFMTDEGLIPNYAFPEAGVTLRSFIWRRKKKMDEEKGAYDSFVYEYERPAVTAISELAPDNHFFAEGRRVRIDQVGLDVSEIERWRFCDSCAYMRQEGLDPPTETCPQCGSPQWADGGQVRPMLRMRKVVATTADRESRIADDSDDREPQFYNRQMLVGYRRDHVTDAYRIDSDEMPFGFEFLSRANFREINFGEKDNEGQILRIAGTDTPKNGFVICKYCGKVQRPGGELKHTLSCASRHKTSATNLTECVYLYREFESEAIKILLPVATSEGSDRKLYSFIAALHLGLKIKYGGNIDHLQTAIHEEPVPDSNLRKRYLMLYDTVPGGTGYLKDLMRSEAPLMEVFESALDRLRHCPCNQVADKDGCYQCLLAYRRSYQMAATSRDTAAQMLADILEYRERMIRVDSIADIKINALFDSELEARFIEALRQVQIDGQAAQLSKQIVNGKPGYFFKLPQAAYYIELQAQLGSVDGVKVASKADFVFHPARGQSGQKPVVVFTDGFFYHKHRIGEDLAQRDAILRSGNFHVWSLSWKDVECRFKPSTEAHAANLLILTDAETKQRYEQFLSGYDLHGFKAYLQMDSFALLVAFLQAPEAIRWSYHAYIQGLARVQPALSADDGRRDRWLTSIDSEVSAEMAAVLREVKAPCFYGEFQGAGDSANPWTKVCLAVPQAAVQDKDRYGMRLVAWLQDGTEAVANGEYEAVWNGYLRLLNVLQFLPNAFFTSPAALAAGHGFALQDRPSEKRASTTGVERSEEWQAVLALAAEEIKPLLDRMVRGGAAPPEVGFELVDEGGAISAEAELAWTDHRIAVLLPEQKTFAAAFVAAGWEVFTPERLDSELDDVLVRLVPER